METIIIKVTPTLESGQFGFTGWIEGQQDEGMVVIAKSVGKVIKKLGQRIIDIQKAKGALHSYKYLNRGNTE